MMILRAVLASLALATVTGAQTLPAPQVASLGTCRLASGEALPDCRVSYRVFGTIDSARSNVVLLPTWFNGTAAGWLPYLGREGYVDTTRFAAIAVDAFGAGRSTSPSDSAWQGLAFPAVAIRDMVSAQQRLLESLEIRRLHAVVGISMGGMQAFEWAVAFPTVPARIVSIEGSPRLSTYDRVQWAAMLHVVETAPRLGMPKDTALRQLARLFVLGGTSPEAVNRRNADSATIIVENQARGLRQRPFENMALQLRAMIGHDIAAHTAGDIDVAARRIRARILVVASPDDHAVTPQSAMALARSIGADTLVVPCPCGHQVFAVERARIGATVRAFLAR